MVPLVGFYYRKTRIIKEEFNPLSPELNPICYLLALLTHDFLHVSRIRVNAWLHSITLPMKKSL
jgi:transposase